jgi:hypothetical protein
MKIGIMRMTVLQPAVRVRMGMGLTAIPGEAMRVLVMLIVNVWMRVLHRVVYVHMLVSLCEMQPDTDAHECARDPERGGRRLPQHKKRERGTKERSNGEICPGACSTKVA